MRVRFQATKGKRLKKQFISVELDCEAMEDWSSWWYYPESKEWRKNGDFRDGETCASSSCSCRSLKSAIRKIKKWNFPKGTMFLLRSRFVGFDIYITK